MLFFVLCSQDVESEDEGEGAEDEGEGEGDEDEGDEDEGEEGEEGAEEEEDFECKEAEERFLVTGIVPSAALTLF